MEEGERKGPDVCGLVCDPLTAYPRSHSYGKVEAVLWPAWCLCPLYNERPLPMTTLPVDLPQPAARKDDPTIWRVDDVLWSRVAPLLVVDKPRQKPGRPRSDDRPLFDGVIWVLR